MNKRLLFHPVFNLQPWNTTEMFHIACHDNEVFFKCCCSNERIHIANLLSLALQQPAYLAILAKGFYAILLEKIHNFQNIVEMLLSSRLVSTKIQLCKSNVRNLTFINSYLPDMFDYAWQPLYQGYACACVKQISSVCQWPHTYQVSTSFTISGPCRNSLAISIGLFSPPQSLWKRASAASNMASESSFHVGRLLVYSCQDFFASSSSRFTCSDICSTNHRRSWRSSVFSIVSKASIGILPIVFILKHVYFIAAKLRIKSE